MRSIPTSTRVLNALLKPTVAGQRTPDHVFDLLLAKAKEASGGTADGDEEFLDGFRRLLRNYSKVDDLTALGWQSVLADIQLRVQNRMRIRRLIREHPQIAEETVVEPVFVVGLPRTATTLIRGVVARSGDLRAPLLWEMSYTDLEVSERERRGYVKSVTQLHKSIGKLSPKFRTAFAADAERPDDCVKLLPHGVHHLTRAHLPDYQAWLGGRDFMWDYEYLKRALQVLQYGRPGARWVIESPAHFDHLSVIRGVFPDAKIVWIHRDPVTVMGSLCSLVETSMSLHVRDPEPHRIGENWLAMTAASIERARRARVSLPRESIVDISYPQLMADPYVGMPHLFERIGAEWTSADEVNLEAVAAAPGLGRAHEYELARYGLTSADVERAFGDYPRTIEHLRPR